MDSNISSIGSRNEFLPDSRFVDTKPAQSPTLQLPAGNAKFVSKIAKEPQLVPFCGLNLATLTVVSSLFSSSRYVTKSYRAKQAAKNEANARANPYSYDTDEKIDDETEKKNVPMHEIHSFQVSVAPIAGYIALDALENALYYKPKECHDGFSVTHYLYSVLRFLHATCYQNQTPDAIGDAIRDMFSIDSEPKRDATRKERMLWKLSASLDPSSIHWPYPETLEACKSLDFDTLEELFFFVVHAKNIHLRPEQIMNFSDAIKYHVQGISNSGIDVAFDELLFQFKTIPAHELLKITPADVRHMSVHEKYKALTIIRQNVQHIGRYERQMLLQYDNIESAHDLASQKICDTLDELIVHAFVQIPMHEKGVLLSLTAKEIQELAEYKKAHLLHIAYALVLQEGEAQEKVRFDKIQKSKKSLHDLYKDYETIAKALHKHLRGDAESLLATTIHTEFSPFAIRPDELEMLINDIEESLNKHKNTLECAQIRHGLFVLKELLETNDRNPHSTKGIHALLEKVSHSVIGQETLIRASMRLGQTVDVTNCGMQNFGPLLDQIINKTARWTEVQVLIPYCKTFIMDLFRHYGISPDECSVLFSTNDFLNVESFAFCKDDPASTCLLQETITRIGEKEKKHAYKKLIRRASRLFANEGGLLVKTLSEKLAEDAKKCAREHAQRFLRMLREGSPASDASDAFVNFYHTIRQNVFLPYLEENDEILHRSDSHTTTNHLLLVKEKTWFLCQHLLTQTLYHYACFVQAYARQSGCIDPLRIDNFINLSINDKNTLLSYIGKPPQEIALQHVPQILNMLDQVEQKKSRTVEEFSRLSIEEKTDIFFVIASSFAYALYRDDNQTRIVSCYNALPSKLQPISCQDMATYNALSITDQERIRYCNALGARFLKNVQIDAKPAFQFDEFQKLKKASKNKLKILLQLYSAATFQEKSVHCPSAYKKMSPEKLAHICSYVVEHAQAAIDAYGIRVRHLQKLTSNALPQFVQERLFEILAFVVVNLELKSKKALIFCDAKELQRQWQLAINTHLEKACEQLQKTVQRAENRLKRTIDMQYIPLGHKCNLLEQKLVIFERQITELQNIKDSLDYAAKHNQTQILIDKETISHVEEQSELLKNTKAQLEKEHALCKTKQHRLYETIREREANIDTLISLLDSITRKSAPAYEIHEAYRECEIRSAITDDLCKRLFETLLVALRERVANPIVFSKYVSFSHKCIDALSDIFVEKPHHRLPFNTLKKELKKHIDGMQGEQRKRLWEAQERLKMLAERENVRSERLF